MRRVESEKECVVEQIKEATNRINEISKDTSHASGTLLEEKFVAERKVFLISIKIPKFNSIISYWTANPLYACFTPDRIEKTENISNHLPSLSPQSPPPSPSLPFLEVKVAVTTRRTTVQPGRHPKELAEI